MHELEVDGTKVAVAHVSEIGFLGDIVWYSCSEQTVPQDQLEALLAKEGVPKEAWPRRTRPIDAYKAAVRSVQSKDYLVEYETVIDPTTGKKRTNTKRMLVVRRELDLARDALPVGMSVMYDEVGRSLAFVPHPGLDPQDNRRLTDEIGAAYELYLKTYSADDIRRMISDAIRRAYAVVLKRSGGVYFVPQKYVHELEAISKVVENLPDAEMVATPVVDREPERKTVIKRYEKATTERIRELMEQVDELVRSGEPLVPSDYGRFLEELEYLKEQKGKYEELLNETMSRVDVEMDVLVARLGKLSVQVKPSAP